MNSENTYCWNRGHDYKNPICKKCATIIHKCFTCGRICVFERIKQPAKGCPQGFDKTPKDEYNICTTCDQIFCDEHMGDVITCIECEKQE